MPIYFSFSEDVRVSGSEMSTSYEKLPVMECVGKETGWSAHHSQKTYQSYKGSSVIITNLKSGLWD